MLSRIAKFPGISRLIWRIITKQFARRRFTLDSDRLRAARRCSVDDPPYDRERSSPARSANFTNDSRHCDVGSRRLTTLCSKMGAMTTIYGDNICILGNAAIRGHKSIFLRIAKTEGFRIRASKTQLVPPNEDKPLPGLIVRNGRATVSDDDLANVMRIVERCVALGETGLANRVCLRYRQHLRGAVGHYAWIDSKAMSEATDVFAQIRWPEKHNRDQCLSPRCYCDVV